MFLRLFHETKSRKAVPRYHAERGWQLNLPVCRQEQSARCSIRNSQTEEIVQNSDSAPGICFGVDVFSLLFLRSCQLNQTSARMLVLLTVFSDSRQNLASASA